jgi:hypothetical protein
VLAAMEAVRLRQSALDEAANLRAGLIAATIINANPYRKKGSPPMKPTDFFREPVKAQSPAEMAQVLDRLAARQNATA